MGKGVVKYLAVLRHFFNSGYQHSFSVLDFALKSLLFIQQLFQYWFLMMNKILIPILDSKSET